MFDPRDEPKKQSLDEMEESDVVSAPVFSSSSTINLGEGCKTVEYFPELNVLVCRFVGKTPRIEIIESTTGCPLKTFPLRIEGGVKVLPVQKALVVWEKSRFGISRELNGTLFLSSVLQEPSSDSTREIVVELTANEATSLSSFVEKHVLDGAEGISGSRRKCAKSVTETVLSQLKIPLGSAESSATQANPKQLKWTSVEIRMVAKNLINFLVACFDAAQAHDSTDGHETIALVFKMMSRIGDLDSSGISSQILHKMEKLLTSNRRLDSSVGLPDLASAAGIGDSAAPAGMFSEYARIRTFATWPHHTYKWAKPDAMAKAGFYHVSSGGQDGAQCFKCKISLVKWEASDEPWSEHERHSPNCPFLRGEPTHNVPLADTLAFSPAITHGKEETILTIGETNHPRFMVTTNSDIENGASSIRIWNIKHLPKLHCKFAVDATDPMITKLFAQMAQTSQPDSQPPWTPYPPNFFDAVMEGSLGVWNVEHQPSSYATVHDSSGDPVNKEQVIQSLKESFAQNYPMLDVEIMMSGGPGPSDSAGAQLPHVTFPDDQANFEVQVESLGVTSCDSTSDGCLLLVGATIRETTNPDPDRNDQYEAMLLVYEIPGGENAKTNTVLTPKADDHELETGLPVWMPNSAFDPVEDEQMEIDLVSEPTNIIQLNSDFVGEDVVEPNSQNDADGTDSEKRIKPKLLQAFPLGSGEEIRVSQIVLEPSPNNAGSTAHICVIVDKQAFDNEEPETSEDILYLFELKSSTTDSEDSENASRPLKLLCNYSYGGFGIAKALLIPPPPLSESELSELSTLDGCASVLVAVGGSGEITSWKVPSLEQFVAPYHNPTDDDFVSITYDQGSDSLCALTDNNVLHFLEVKQPHIKPSVSQQSLSDQLVAGSGGQELEMSTSVLEGMSKLSEFVTLTPRFQASAMPASWTEVEQEQQQRKFSEHMPRLNSSMHTRTFKVSNDSGSAAVELTLPSNVLVGHVDLKLHFKQKPVGVLVSLFAAPQNDASLNTGSGRMATRRDLLVGPVSLEPFFICQTSTSASVSLTSALLPRSRHRILTVELNLPSDSTASCLNLQEVSIAIRKMKVSPSAASISQLQSMISNEYLPRKLLSSLLSPESIPNQNLHLSAAAIQHRSLELLCWLAYVHAVSPDPDKLRSLANECQSQLDAMIDTCWITGKRTTGHLLARLLVIFMRFSSGYDLGSLLDALEDALIHRLSASVTSVSHANLFWFHLFLSELSRARSHSGDCAPVHDRSATFQACYQLLKTLISASRDKLHQDTLLKTLQSKFRIFCNPFEQHVFSHPMQQVVVGSAVVPLSLSKTKAAIVSAAAGGGGAPMLGVPSSAANINQDMLHMMFSARKSANNKNGTTTVDTKMKRSFCDLFVSGPLTMENRQLLGILEAEPLHFTCSESSDGAKVEEECEIPGLGGGAGPLNDPVSDFLYGEDEPDLFPDLLTIHSANSGESTIPSVGPQVNKPKTYSEAVLSSAKYPALSTSAGDGAGSSVGGNTLASLPHPHFVYIDNLLSGGRKWVVLDFGKPILLTDICLGPCPELFSLTLDTWLNGESVDLQRLGTCLDIAAAPFTLTDMHPPVLCRYLKILIIGRYGMVGSGQQKVVLPINMLYGHTFDLEYQSNAESPDSSRNIEALQEKHLNAVSIIHDHLQCRYSLAVAHLKALLSAHSTSLAEDPTVDQTKKVVEACSNCRTLQLHLNVVSRVVERIKSHHIKYEPAPLPANSLALASSSHLFHSTRFILIALCNYSADQPGICALSEDDCSVLLEELCINGLPSNCVFTLVLLHRLGHRQSWWGRFVARSFLKFFSQASNPDNQLHVFKVVLTLLHLARQDSCLDQVCQNLIHLLLQCLPENLNLLTSGSSEWQQISCLLMILSQALISDPTAPTKKGRWNFLPNLLDEWLQNERNAASNAQGDKDKARTKKDKRKPVFGVQKSALHLSKASLSALSKAEKDFQKDLDMVFQSTAQSGSSSGRFPKSTRKASSVTPPPPMSSGGSSLEVAGVCIEHGMAKQAVSGLLSVLPQLIRSQSQDLVLLLCRVCSSLSAAGSPMLSLGSVFNDELLIGVLTNAFVVNNNPLIAHTVQCLLLDLMEAEVTPARISLGRKGSGKSRATVASTLSDSSSSIEAACARTLEKVQKSELELEASVLASLESSDNSNEGLPSGFSNADMFVLLDKMQESQAASETLLADFPSAGPFFPQYLPSSIKGISIKSAQPTSPQTPAATPAHASATEKSINCQDIRLEVGFANHFERWLSDLQRTYNSRVTDILSCLSLNPLKQPPPDLLQSSESAAKMIKTDDGDSGVDISNTRRLLRAVFNRLFSPTVLPYLDLREILLLWYRLNDVFTCSSSSRGSNQSSFLTAPELIVSFSDEDITQIFSKVTVENVFDPGVWCILFKCLSLGCLSKADDASGGNPMGNHIINNLIRYAVLDTFLSGGYYNAKTELCHGPHVTEAFSVFLLNLCTCSYPPENHKALLGELLLKLIKALCEFSGGIKQSYGPVDSQIALVDFMVCNMSQAYDARLMCLVTNVIAKLAYDFISGYRSSVRVSAGGQTTVTQHNPCCCLTEISGSASTCPASGKMLSGREKLLIHLLKLADNLVQTKVNPSTILSKVSGDTTVADCIIQDPQLHTINTLLVTLSYCTLAKSAHPICFGVGDKTAPVEFERVTIADHVLHLLMKLNEFAHERALLHERLVSILKMPDLGMSCCLSEPVLFFFHHLLSDRQQEVLLFAAVGGITALASRVVDSASTGPGIGFRQMPMAILKNLAQSFVHDDRKRFLTPPRNVAPKGRISCTSDPTAQLPDVLIQENPPHKRSRSAAWTYHFPQEQESCVLSISLANTVLLEDIEIRLQMPAMGLNQNVPSSVSVEVFADHKVPTSITPPLIVTKGSNSLVLKLVRPALCAKLALRFYHVPEVNSIGLSHIAVNAIPVLNAANDPNLFVQLTPTTISLHAIKLIDTCLCQMDESFGSSPAIPEHQQFVSACLSLLSHPSAESYFPSIKRTLHKICSTVPHMLHNVIVTLLSSFLSGGETVSSIYVEECLDFLVNLCSVEDENCLARAISIVTWLDEHLVGLSASHNSKSIAHVVHTISSILWSLNNIESLSALVSIEHFTRIARCAVETDFSHSLLKESFDWLLCTYCHLSPSFLKTLFRLLKCPDLVLGEFSFQDPVLPKSPTPSPSDDTRSQKSSLAKHWWTNIPRSHLDTLHHCLSDKRVLDMFRNFAPVGDLFALLLDLSMASAMSASEASTLAVLLNFLTNVCRGSPQARRWLGQIEKTRFWSPLLSALCYEQSKHADLCSSSLQFFEACADHNQVNQKNLAEIVSQLISQRKDSLNSFIKQLVLNVFLKEETMLVVVRSAQDKLGKFKDGISALSHPKYGAGHGISMGRIDLDKSLDEILLSVIGGSASEPASLAQSFMESMANKQPAKLTTSGSTTDLHDPSLYLQGSPKPPPSSDKPGPPPPPPNMPGYFLVSPKQLLSMESVKKKASQIAGVPGGSFKGKSHHKLAALIAKKKQQHMQIIKNSGQAALAMHEQNKTSSGSDAPVENALLTLKMELANKKMVHRTLGADLALPGTSSVRDLHCVLKQIQAKDVEDGYIVLDIVSRSCEDLAEGPEVADLSSFSTSLDQFGYRSQKAQSSGSVVLRPADMFAQVGGFAKLALRLPVLNPDFVKVVSSSNIKDSARSSQRNRPQSGGGDPSLADWVLIENSTGKSNTFSSQIYDAQWETSDEENYPMDWADEFGAATPTKSSSGGTSASSLANKMPPCVPPHSLALLGLSLQLPHYANILLQQERKARYLLRILLGVTDVGDGSTSILKTAEAKSLPTLPFEALYTLFQEYPLMTDAGLTIRQQCVEAQILDLLFGCLAVLTHRNSDSSDVKAYQFLFPDALFGVGGNRNFAQSGGAAKGGGKKAAPQYWAKGTGFGTGSMQSGWNMEQAQIRKAFEEHNNRALLQVISAFIGEKSTQDENETGGSSQACAKCADASDVSIFTYHMYDLISQSCLIQVLNSYLINDSVLDISRHVAVYQAVLSVIRSLSAHKQLLVLMTLPVSSSVSSSAGSSNNVSLYQNLLNMYNCVRDYTSHLNKNVSATSTTASTATSDDKDDDGTEGVTTMEQDLELTFNLLQTAIDRDADITIQPEPTPGTSGAGINLEQMTDDQIYCNVMKSKQFQPHKMIKSGSGKNIVFSCHYHFLSEARVASDTLNTKRTKRLAQESVTLSTSLPLAYSSSVFVRYDEDRLDIMKVLITGPDDTPYANGCFVFDIFFPSDYPNSPMLCNFITTGGGTVRFNPNLYNDGKVCLSILNTWHGRPEEKWNAQLSNLLQVLVSIQSLILVSEPYFNEPGYERSRNTPAGQQSSDEYNANIRQATVRWAMLNQLKNPCPSFKDVIQSHFYLKKDLIMKQCKQWLSEMESMSKNKRFGKNIGNHASCLRKNYSLLVEELNKLKPPAGLEGQETAPKPDESQMLSGVPADVVDCVDSMECSESTNQPTTGAVDNQQSEQLMNSVFGLVFDSAEHSEETG